MLIYLSCLNAYIPNAGSFSAYSYWACYSPVMNPVARLAWLRFLLHIPGRCQGPHRRQRSLPKSQPCYTDECVCPVLWSRLSAWAFVCMCVPLLLCMFSLCACFSLPLYVRLSTSVCVCLSCHEHTSRLACLCVLQDMWLYLKMRLEMNVWGKVKWGSFLCTYRFLWCILLSTWWATCWSQ